MRIEWLVSDVTPIVSPERAERDIFGVILGVFWPIQTANVAGESLCDLETPY